MFFGLAVAQLGIGLAIWLLCACVVVPIAGLVATVKSEGAAVVPFAGFGIGLWVAIQVLGAKHTIYSSEVLHWAPMLPSIGFGLGFLALWPSPRAVGLAVGGCLLFMEIGEMFTRFLALLMLLSLFAGMVPALCSITVVATVAVSYWGRAKPWLEAKKAAERGDHQRALDDQRQHALQEPVWQIEPQSGFLVLDGEPDEVWLISPHNGQFALHVFGEDETLLHAFGPFETQAYAMSAGSALVRGDISPGEISSLPIEPNSPARRSQAPLYWTAPDWLRSSFPGISIEVEDAVLRRNPRLHTSLWEVDQALQAGPDAGVSPADFHRAAESLVEEFQHTLTELTNGQGST